MEKNTIAKNKKTFQNPPGTSKFRALESDSPPRPEKISQSMRIAIQKARQSSKMTQKKLAKILNVIPNLISEYESGKAIPNKQILSKLKNVFGSKLNYSIYT